MPKGGKSNRPLQKGTRTRRMGVGLGDLTVALLVTAVALCAVMGYNASQARSFQVSDVAPVNVVLERTPDVLAAHLARAVQFETTSYEDTADDEAEERLQPFLDMHVYMREIFPRVFREIPLEMVNRGSMLFTWQGSDPSLAPLLLCSHQDVVPIPNPHVWEHGPFSGHIADGYVWGRGTMDDKNGVFGILEAVEQLLGEGFQPTRTVLLAFGHDEEVMGRDGAGHIRKVLEERGYRPYLVLDEGMVIADKMTPGTSQPVAYVGVAEKGFLNLKMTASQAPGHSSTPPKHTAVGVLAQGIQQLEDSPLPTDISFVENTFGYIAHEMGTLFRTLFTNLWITRPLVEYVMGQKPATAALLRTTTAVTMVRGGVKANQLPANAAAHINFRVMPGDTIHTILSHIEAHVAGAERSAEAAVVAEENPHTFARARGGGGGAHEHAGHAHVRLPIQLDVMQYDAPSPVANVESEQFRLLQRTVAQVFPDVIVAPAIMLGGTDVKHYVHLAEESLRFCPMRLRDEDVARIHGDNERLAVSNYVELVQFYYMVVQNFAK